MIGDVMMKLNKGFTLVELLSVIIILGVIGLIAIPTINKAIKDAREELYKVQINNIELGAKSWAAENVLSLPEGDGEVVTLTLGQLKVSGHIQLDIRNPKTKKLFPNDMEITITKHINSYLYDVLEDTGTYTGNEDQLDLTLPTIVLKGSTMEYVEIGGTYTEPGVIARNSAGTEITDITTQIKSNNVIIPEVDATRFGQYKITYTVTDSGKTASIIRTVTIRDTTAPQLTVPADNTILASDAATFNAMTGVSATDNSGQTVTITTSGTVSTSPGTYAITYTATDIKGNSTVKQRKVTVTSS
jgi:prepilin-type N-terminal cleavage/methylation domain-containing protein